MSDIAALNSVFVRYLVKVLWIREMGGRIILILLPPAILSATPQVFPLLHRSADRYQLPPRSSVLLSYE